MKRPRGKGNETVKKKLDILFSFKGNGINRLLKLRLKENYQSHKISRIKPFSA